MSKFKHTTSMICCNVRPNLTSNGSLSLATGRSSVLYVASSVFSKRFSWGPCSDPVNNEKKYF